MSELKAFESERIYWAVEQVEREAGDIADLHLDDNLFYLKSEVDKVIAEKDKEIAELKAKLESVQASMYCDVVDANMENRRLKRALWLSRADRAHKEVILFRDFSCLVGKEFKWRKIEKLCRAKAEEYK